MTTTTKHPTSSNRVAVAALAVAAALVGAALTWTVVPSVSAAVGMGVLGALGVVVLAEAVAVVWSWRHNREERAALKHRSQAASLALAAASASPSLAETWFPPLEETIEFPHGPGASVGGSIPVHGGADAPIYPVNQYLSLRGVLGDDGPIDVSNVPDATVGPTLIDRYRE